MWGSETHSKIQSNNVIFRKPWYREMQTVKHI